MAALREMMEGRAPGPDVCPHCRGTGIISRWTEISYFEDRRYCPACADGHALGEKIIQIIKRTEGAEHDPSEVR